MHQDEINKEVEFLNIVYEDAQIGSESIEYVTGKIEDANMLKDLQNQHSQYTDLSNKATSQIANHNQVPKSRNSVSKAGLRSRVRFNTLMNKSNDNVAEVMIQESMIGVIDMSRVLKQFSEIPQETKQLGQELIGIEENNMQIMKQYLG
ncbi:MAG: hypothetical protein WBK75_00210 [Acutalibacteraceae bacterium]|jgi:uncharacterized radical SAM superfamily Fe-S cluster-containing enzyme|nr:hypothetical protein [Clostridiales bacterium]